MGSNPQPGELMPPNLSSPWFEDDPSPVATTEGPTHRIRDVNPAFCRLTGKTREDLLEKPFYGLLMQGPECQAQLDAVYHSGKPALPHSGEQADSAMASCSFAMWPVVAKKRTIGVVIQVTDNARLQERTLAMNEALLLGSLRQHELVAAANEANVSLQAEVVQRMQSESDALMLTKEISHRIKNNLQVVVALIARETSEGSPALARQFAATETRISAIAELYDLISQSNGGDKVRLDTYLDELARSMAASLLEPGSAIRIEVKSEAAEIDSDRAVPFGLLVNELVTNAIKHAFPDGVGLLVLKIKRAADMIQLTIADNGIGIKTRGRSKALGRHGSDYVAIFVRQLGGTMTVSGSDTTGTIVRVRFPSISPTDRHPLVPRIAVPSI